MTNKRFIKTVLFTTGFLCVAAAGVALIRVRAQVANVQPFVAVMVEEMAPRKDQFPTPIVRFQRIAVRSDGSISKVSKWDARLPTRVLYSREVIDATTKTHEEVEDKTRTVVSDEYSDIQVLQPGVLCDGKPAGQVEGFDVVAFLARMRISSSENISSFVATRSSMLLISEMPPTCLVCTARSGLPSDAGRGPPVQSEAIRDGAAATIRKTSGLRFPYGRLPALQTAGAHELHGLLRCLSDSPSQPSRTIAADYSTVQGRSSGNIAGQSPRETRLPDYYRS
jgi:hypothetical protein